MSTIKYVKLNKKIVEYPKILESTKKIHKSNNYLVDFSPEIKPK